MKRRSRPAALAATAVSVALILSGCSGAGALDTVGGGGKSISVLAINAAQMQNLQKLTEKYFTKRTGIKVNYTLLPENDLRAKLNAEFSTQAGQYDIGSVAAFEVPIYSKNGWLAPLSQYAEQDTTFDQGDIFPKLTSALTGADGELYAEPFFGEGSFTMYRKDIFEKAGVTMPARPTWRQIEQLAAKTDGVDGASGICLRGLAGWGQNLAVLNTMVNTFGGTWFDEDWNAKVTDPAFREATEFYVDLLKKYGEKGAAQSGVLECLNGFVQGKSAIFYDASSVASSVEAAGSPVRGKVGYVAAPHERTRNAGWLWTWGWGVETASKKKDAAWKFISWASSKQYEKEVAKEFGGTAVPAGKRASTYRDADYRTAAAAFFRAEYDAVQDAPDPRNPGLQPRPYSGVQFLGIPQWPDLGTKAGTQIADAIAGKQSVDDALRSVQSEAEQTAEDYRK